MEPLVQELKEITDALDAQIEGYREAKLMGDLDAPERLLSCQELCSAGQKIRDVIMERQKKEGWEIGGFLRAVMDFDELVFRLDLTRTFQG